MTGKPYAMRLATGIRRPKNPVPGRDVAGTVEQVDADITWFKPGDTVHGVAPGAFAEYAVSGEDRLALMPAGLTFAEAAVIPISAGTAPGPVQALGGHARRSTTPQLPWRGPGHGALAPRAVALRRRLARRMGGEGRRAGRLVAELRRPCGSGAGRGSGAVGASGRR